MIFLIAAAAGILVGLLTGGKLSCFYDHRMKKLWLIMLSFVLQAVAMVMAARGFSFVNELAALLVLLVNALLLTGIWFNRRYLGLVIIGAGSIMNAIVMLANGGKMPVDADILIRAGYGGAIDAVTKGLDLKHVLLEEGTNLKFLSDWIHPPGFLAFGMQAVSLGDLVVSLGIAVMLYELITNRRIFKR